MFIGLAVFWLPDKMLLFINYVERRCYNLCRITPESFEMPVGKTFAVLLYSALFSCSAKQRTIQIAIKKITQIYKISENMKTKAYCSDKLCYECECVHIPNDDLGVIFVSSSRFFVCLLLDLIAPLSR